MEGKIRDTEAMLSPGEYLFMADPNGQIQVVTGPVKKSIDSANELLVFDDVTQQFERVTSVNRAICRMPVVDETSYVVLHNPAEDDVNTFPKTGTTNAIPLKTGKRVNIQGPCSFPLWPGQIANVIPGHTLRTNQYLIVRVYNEQEAKDNWEKAVIQKVENKPDEKDKDTKLLTSLGNGQLFVIKGTEVSFYIPPTGLEVIPDENGNFVRDAVTLENLEYCILKNESGIKRYIPGPDVVFPKPDETFDQKGGNRNFRGIELNENMGIYVKVTSPYDTFEIGEELFITGKDTKIYMPRPEHAIIKYGETDFIHYAVAVPEGEGRYVLDKTTGDIKLVRGPEMLLPDPRNQVIVRRILNESQCELWYPGNREVAEYNLGMIRAEEGMSGIMMDSADSDYYVDEEQHTRGITIANVSRKEMRSYSKAHDLVSDAMSRNQKFTKPRTITMTDSKYEGAVKVGVWPGYAIQVIDANGKREVVFGPTTKLLSYNDTLEVLTLSTATPKTDKRVLKTTYLQTKHNQISDIVGAITKDMVEVFITVAYKVDFITDQADQWFTVPDYVKLLTDHCRSLVVNLIKQHTIEEVNTKYINLIRDIILGANEEGKREGRKFENGMVITDVDVKEIEIGDPDIAELIEDTQQDSVKSALNVIKSQKGSETSKLIEKFEQEKLRAEQATELLRISNINAREDAEIEQDQEREKQRVTIETTRLEAAKLEAENNTIRKTVDVDIEKDLLEAHTTAFEKQFAAIQPGLIEALTASGQMGLAAELAKTIPASRNTLHDLFDISTIGVLKNAVKGTPLEEGLKKLETVGHDNGVE